jgi:phosphate transport system permease protein
VPLGLAAAVYLSEFASVRTRESLKVVVELLAAIPSVVWGFVGVMLLNPLLQAMGAQIGLNGLNGALLLALMTLPLLVSLGEDALRAVPDSYRQAATAMGATRWEMVTRVLLPAARPGLLVAVLLGVGRCVGETMAVLMATGHQVNIPTSLYAPVRTLTATIAAELGEAVRGGEHYRTLFMLGLLLFAITFVVNVTADLVIRGRRR